MSPTISTIIEHTKNRVLNYTLGWVYRFYEWRLEKSVMACPRPRHIGIILDGNRRWARERSMPPTYGHKVGYDKAKQVLEWCWQLGIHTVTVYALSLDNMRKRSQEEVNSLIGLVEHAVEELSIDPRIRNNSVKVKVIGRKELLPVRLLEKINTLEDSTSQNTKHNLFLAVGYSGRGEIIDAVRKIVRDAGLGVLSYEKIDEQVFSKYLYTAGADDPDLILRTGGETRLSDFLPWQAIYSEFVFMDMPWPDLRRIDFLRAIRTYQSKQRRFGS
ncbi:MAG: polyprenyl diphosphate synthase [Thermoprotei archaeon]